MPDPNRMVRAGDLMLAADVRKLAGAGSRATLLRWRRDRGFPEPVRSIKAGRGKRAQVVEIWSRSDVKAWMKSHPPASNLIDPPPSP